MQEISNGEGESTTEVLPVTSRYQFQREWGTKCITIFLEIQWAEKSFTILNDYNQAKFCFQKQDDPKYVVAICKMIAQATGFAEGQLKSRVSESEVEKDVWYRFKTREELQQQYRKNWRKISGFVVELQQSLGRKLDPLENDSFKTRGYFFVHTKIVEGQGSIIKVQNGNLLTKCEK